MSTVIDVVRNSGSLVAVGTMASTGAQSVSTSASNAIIFFPTNTGNCTISLPAPVAGLKYKFIATGVGAATSYTFALTGAIGKGTRVANIPAGTTSASATGVTNIISGAAANLLAGDSLELTCDGTNWYYYAISSGAAAGWSTS